MVSLGWSCRSCLGSGRLCRKKNKPTATAAVVTAKLRKLTRNILVGETFLILGIFIVGSGRVGSGGSLILGRKIGLVAIFFNQIEYFVIACNTGLIFLRIAFDGL